MLCGIGASLTFPICCLGERMDYRHCETLEEVLRRVQFRTMDLEGTGLEDEVRVQFRKQQIPRNQENALPVCSINK